MVNKIIIEHQKKKHKETLINWLFKQNHCVGDFLYKHHRRACGFLKGSSSEVKNELRSFNQWNVWNLHASVEMIAKNVGDSPWLINAFFFQFSHITVILDSTKFKKLLHQ